MVGIPITDADTLQHTMGFVAASQPDDLRCCCGKEDCVFLKHNCSVLSSVERDVHTAARMGQTLLARHEAYMVSAERDRLELTARIEQLERENTELEARNKAVTEENHGLRDELEQLNDTVNDAETKIGLLEATLLDSQREVRRLEIAADRAASLERQITILEEEQVVLRTTIARTEEEARTTMYRWRQAEKGLSDLQEQLERMEKEAREERERHVEVIGRMERQRAMEKELNTAAGRLKGAAAVKSMTESRSGGSAVAHFVRDLLQDNANLQLGIAELREMLLSSNDEIQMLREHLMYHQPAGNQEPGSPKTLRAELEKKEPLSPPQPPRVSQELHIHHHYHVSHKPDVRKSRKRRHGLTSGTFTPPQFSAPGSPIGTSARFQRGALAGPLLSPPPGDRPTMSAAARWSLQTEDQSEFIPSSAPSSPRSANRDSVFDRVPDLPSPASPTTSVDPASPGWKTAHRKKVSEFSLRSISETAMLSTDRPHLPHAYPPRPQPLTSFLSNEHSPATINSPYTTDDVPSITSPSLGGYPVFNPPTDLGADEDALASPSSSQFDPSVEQRPRDGGLRRVVSHESIMSLANGLDIHTLKTRPSQLALRPLGSPTAAGTNLSAVTAQPMLSSSLSAAGKRGSVILRDTLVNIPTSRQGGGESRGRERGRERDGGGGRRSTPRAPSALGKLVSWRPWGGGGGGGGTNNSSTNDDAAGPTETSPSSTPASMAPSAPSLAPSPAIPTLSLSLPPTAGSASTSLLGKSPQESVSSMGTSSTGATAMAAGNAALAAMFRAPGINQPGAVPGFQELWAAQKRRAPPSKVAVDNQGAVQEALREVLEEL
ncbi:hypothetical protein N657DRAFT_649453 [Parathielavia appendiculata]|uniref:Uncharacterized protein n=1 Tax=Parathielavia appendiculata TaxID=2587402 RepID=A0AAN6TSV9_9PEZI|nr:hypothetical protein N657DRAFT_649453 [Parathielavia appendiculata]